MVIAMLVVLASLGPIYIPVTVPEPRPWDRAVAIAIAMGWLLANP